MTDLHKELHRGEQAKRIIEDPMVREALDLIRDNLIGAWKKSKVADKEVREEAYRMLHALEEFERYFLTVMQTGKLAEHQLSTIEKAKQKVANLWR